MNAVQQGSFLRIPPFPGARPSTFAVQFEDDEALEVADIDRLLSLVRELKVGGDYWASQPRMPGDPYTLIRIRDESERSRILADLPSEQRIVCWIDSPVPTSQEDGVSFVSGACDPWHLVGGAARVIADADVDLALVAAIVGVPLTCIGEGAFAALSSEGELSRIFRSWVVNGISYRNPFTNEPAGVEAAVRLCGFWRQLIDSNREITGAVGFAFWKRPTVTALLWGGSDVNFISKRIGTDVAGKIAVWKSRASTALLSELEQAGATLIEVEDGFIRSAGLGADCVPPLSIVIDRLGVHFDPSRESELERLLQEAQFSDEVLERARLLRELIVASGVSKYGSGSATPPNRIQAQRYVLVPGQVEDDRAVLCGGGEVEGNLDLLRRVRRDGPDAFILYKPHPDVEAGHRVGGVADEQCLEFADEIVRGQPISALISFVDEVHVNTSLAGFEALMREKPVTTHGVPFYAGWGLTRDLGPVPARRTKTRGLDELVAAVLLQYPRYLDPVTGLPCPPEVLVHRIVENGAESRRGMVVQMRRFQGRLKKKLAGLGVSR
jgi:capsular polysaccharide export protein